MLVFVGSPYSGDVNCNLTYAREACLAVSFHGESYGLTPFAPHLLYTQFLDDTSDQQRERGIAHGLDVLNKCNFALFFIDNGITVGMRKEIDHCLHNGIPHRLVSRGFVGDVIIEYMCSP